LYEKQANNFLTPESGKLIKEAGLPLKIKG
jgi:hypothetical protein